MHCPKNNLIFRVKPSMSYQGVGETVNVWFLGLKCAQKLDICVMCMYCTLYIYTLVPVATGFCPAGYFRHSACTLGLEGGGSGSSIMDKRYCMCD